MAESNFIKILNVKELKEAIMDIENYEYNNDQISIILYYIYVYHNDNAEEFLQNSLLIDGHPYSANTDGNLAMVAKRFLRNPDSFQFTEKFLSIISDIEV